MRPRSLARSPARKSEGEPGACPSLLAALLLVPPVRTPLHVMGQLMGQPAGRPTVQEEGDGGSGAGESVWTRPLIQVEDQPITVQKILLGVALLILGVIAARFLAALLRKNLLSRVHLAEGAVAAFSTITFYLLIVVFAISALNVAGVPLTALTFLGGAVAIGVGFGSQNLVNNFLSGLILLVERPIRVGDLVQVDGLHGNVENIGARSTRIKTGDNVELLVPNSKFLEQNVVNWTLSETRVRISVSVGVSYGSPVEEVGRILREVVDENERIFKTPEPIVLFSDFGDNALAFEVHFWIQMRRLMERRRIESEVRFGIDRAFREAGIVIAFPQRDVHLDSLRPIEVRVVGGAPGATTPAGAGGP